MEQNVKKSQSKCHHGVHLCQKVPIINLNQNLNENDKDKYLVIESTYL
jgi:hypothetical protein